MIRHLTPADYRPMPWANGRGVTVEMLRVDVAGAMSWRLSRASVVEDGDFSMFAGVERNLTVISGPGFDLVGPMGVLPARPFKPVAFAGDVPLRATGVTAPSDDFNVMTARGLALPQVQVVQGNASFAAGGTLAVFALGRITVNAVQMAQYDLIVTETDIAVSADGQAIVVKLFV